MTLIACGLNHTTAPLQLRERLSFSTEHLQEPLSRLLDTPTVNEAVILSTCNRTELYCETVDESDGIMQWLASHQAMPLDTLSPHTYLYKGPDAIRHMMRVASGLDSMMIGEPQVLGQMKSAYNSANSAGSLGNNLEHVFRHVFEVTKRIRTETEIGSKSVSIANAAVKLIDKVVSDIQNATILLIGAGETIELLAWHLHQDGARNFTLANRTRDNATALAKQYKAQVLAISDIAEYLPNADVVITATACPIPFLTKNMAEKALQKRSMKPICFVDLSVPRDIEADITELSQAHLFNIDSLQDMVEQGKGEQDLAAKQAELIIDAEVNNFVKWKRSLRAADTIRCYREKVETIRDDELQKAMQALQKGHDPERVMSLLARNLSNKIMHQPSINLKKASYEGREKVLSIAKELFEL